MLPETVTAVGSSIVDPAIGATGDGDTAVVTLRWADGRVATIRNSRRAVYGHDQNVGLLGSEGLLGAGNGIENTVSRSATAGAVSAKPECHFLERYMRACAAERAALVAAVGQGADLPVTLDDGVNALALAEAATRSHETREVVEVASVGVWAGSGMGDLWTYPTATRRS